MQIGVQSSRKEGTEKEILLSGSECCDCVASQKLSPSSVVLLSRAVAEFQIPRAGRAGENVVVAT